MRVGDDDDDADDDHDEDGGCSRCESTGACPTCHSLSPWRCGCNDEEEGDDDDAQD